jgi:methionine sulfoxide reductase heme-binding subunit
MPTRILRILKVIVFMLSLVPFAGMVWSFQADNLGADPVQTLTHWTGDWTMYMLLGSLAITPIRRLSPKIAWLIRFRRMIGLFAFFYGTLHMFTYVFLFSGFDVTSAFESLRQHDFAAIADQWRTVWPTMMEDVAKRRFIQVGLLAYVILLALAVTSPQWVLLKMGGKPWQTLHRTVYGAAVLGVIHYWWLVKKGVISPGKDTVVLGILLLARPAYLLLKKKPVARPVNVAS